MLILSVLFPAFHRIYRSNFLSTTRRDIYFSSVTIHRVLWLQNGLMIFFNLFICDILLFLIYIMNLFIYLRHAILHIITVLLYSFFSLATFLNIHFVIGQTENIFNKWQENSPIFLTVVSSKKFFQLIIHFNFGFCTLVTFNEYLEIAKLQRVTHVALAVNYWNKIKPRTINRSVFLLHVYITPMQIIEHAFSNCS